MKKSDVPRNPSYFDNYIDQVADIELLDAFQQSIDQLDQLDVAALHQLGDRVYAPGKWTVRDLFQHLIDCERIFNYRALRFARADDTPLPGFDEEVLAANSGANNRPLDDILQELRVLRQSSQQLFASFDDTMLRRSGVMYKSELPVLAIGFTLVGHQVHHFRVLEARYFPLLQTTV